MTYEFRDGARSNAKPLIGIYSESGTGKTYGALLVARGFVGPKGKVGMIETESGRGEAYADPTEYPEIGGYKVLSLRDNFGPEEYGQAIAAAEREKLDALIIDSASHEWDGAGGVLDMADANTKGPNPKKGVLVWQGPKIAHSRKFMLKVLQTPIPLVILCMRAKYPMREATNPKTGKREWIRSEQLEPRQADDILYEMFIHGWIDHEHRFHLTKSTARALDSVFQTGKPLSIETGQQLAQWAAGGDVPEKREGAPSASAGPSLIDRAREATVGGSAALQHFWERELTKQERKQLGPHLAALKATAEDYDEAVNKTQEPPAEKEDIPFDAPTESQDSAPTPETRAEPCAPTESQQASANGRLRYVDVDGKAWDETEIDKWRMGLAQQIAFTDGAPDRLSALEKHNAAHMEAIRKRYPDAVAAIERALKEAGGQQTMAV